MKKVMLSGHLLSDRTTILRDRSMTFARNDVDTNSEKGHVFVNSKYV